MYEQLATCYSFYFEKSYKPCDQWALGEFFIGVGLLAIVLAIAFSVSRQVRG